MVQVVCAGVWHNAVLCALCWLCALLLPLLLTPLYSTGIGATVRYILHANGTAETVCLCGPVSVAVLTSLHFSAICLDASMANECLAVHVVAFFTVVSA